MGSHLLAPTVVHLSFPKSCPSAPQTSGLPELWICSLALYPSPPPPPPARSGGAPRGKGDVGRDAALVECPLRWALIHSLGGRRRSRGQQGAAAARRKTRQVSPAAALGPACSVPPGCQRARGAEPTPTGQRGRSGRAGPAREG